MKNILLLTMMVTAGITIQSPFLMAQVSPDAVTQRQTVDGIAAVVGGEIILKSDVEMLFRLRVQEQGLESLSEAEEEALRSYTLRELIDMSLIVARANRDSIVVERGEVEEAIDQWLSEIQASYGGESIFQQQLRREGITLAELRRRRRPLVRNQLLQAKLQQGLGIGIPTAVSRMDAERFIRENADGMLFLRHIFLEPPPDVDPGAMAEQRINELRALIIDGREDFAGIARQFSDDTGSGQMGGDLGEAPRGTYLASVDSTVWNIPIGEISMPVQSPVGWHLIEVISRDAEKAHARHILVQVAEEGSATRALADTISLVENALVGGESFIDLVERFSDEPGASEKKGYFGMLFLPLTPANSGLSAEWIEELETMEPGDWAGPLELENKVHFIQRIPWDESTLNLALRNDFPRVELFVQRQRSEAERKAWLEELRRETYIEIKKD